MAEEIKKSLQIDVVLNSQEYIKKAAEASETVENLRAQQKQLDRTTAEGELQYQKYAAQITNARKELRQYQTQAANALRANADSTASIDELSAALSVAERTYKGLSAEFRQTADGKALRDTIKQLRDEYKAANVELGNTAVLVGDYRGAIQDTGVTNELFAEGINDVNGNLNELRQRLRELQNISFAGKSEEEIAKIKSAISDTQTAISDFRNDINGIDTDNLFKNINTGLQTVTSSFVILNTSLAQFGVQSEQINKVNKVFAGLITTVTALNTVYTFLNKNKLSYITTTISAVAATQAENLAKRVNALNSQAQAAGDTLSTATKIRLTATTKLATAAQWLWNAAITANPVGALVVGVAALVTGLYVLIEVLNKQTDAQKAANESMKEYNRITQETESSLEAIRRKREKVASDLDLQARQEILTAKQNGATKQQLAEIEYRNANRQRDAQIELSRQTLKTLEVQLFAARQNIESQRALLDTLKQGTKEYYEQVKAVNALVAAYNGIVDQVNTQFRNIASLQLQQQEADQAFTASTKSNATERANSAADEYEKTLNAQRDFNISRLKAEADYQKTDFATKLKYASQIYELEVETSRKILENQKKSGKLTAAQYQVQLDTLNNQYAEFYNKQAKDSEEFFKSVVKSAYSALDDALDFQFEQIEQKYKDLYKQIENIPPPKPLSGESDEDFKKRLSEYEKFLYNRVELETRLEQQKEKELEKIREQFKQNRVQQIEKEVAKQYRGDLAAFSNNELEKLRVLNVMLKEQIKRKKEAGLDTLKDEELLARNEQQIRLRYYNIDLLKAEDNAKKRYDVRKEYLQRELELFKDNAEKQLEISQELKDLERELLDERIENFQDWTDAVYNMFNSFNSLLDSISDRRLAKYKKDNEEAQKALKKRLDADLISQTQYESELEKLDEAYQENKAKLERQQAKREKALKIFGVVTDTAAGIAKAVAASPLTFGLPWSAFVAATGALQLASIISEPLPQAAKGMYVDGKRHTQGGEIIETEDGEVIITRNAVTPETLPILSRINEAGGGIPFTNSPVSSSVVSGLLSDLSNDPGAIPFNLSDGGYSTRNTGGVNSASTDEVANMLAAAFAEIGIYVTVEDIRKADKNYSQVEDRGNVF